MIEPVSLADWVAFDENHPAPTFFARPAWALALASVFPNLRPMPLRVHLEARSLLVPVMQSTSRLPWRGIVGFPLGGYTCVLDDSGAPAAAEETRDVLEELSRSFHRVSITLWPFQAMPPTSNSWPHRTHGTAVVDLRDGIEGVLRKAAGRSRRMAGQALRRGVTCERIVGENALDEYYAILEEAAKWWGLAQPPYPRALIRGLLSHGGDDVQVWIARTPDDIIAAGIVFYGSSEAFFWSAAMRRQYSRLRPSNALNYALISEAAHRGLRWYNLGSSEGLPGVERFKRDLGATMVSYVEMHHERPMYHFYDRLRNSMLTHALQVKM